MREKAKWVNAKSGKEITTGENSQIRSSLLETEDKSVTGVVHLHKWAKYCTATDKQQGLTKENVPFRPAGGSSGNGISFPASIIPSLIDDLQGIYDFAVANGMVDFDPSVAQETAKVAPKPKTRKKVI